MGKSPKRAPIRHRRLGFFPFENTVPPLKKGDLRGIDLINLPPQIPPAPPFFKGGI